MPMKGFVVREACGGGDDVGTCEQQLVGDQERHPDRTAVVQYPGRPALPRGVRLARRRHLPPSGRLHSSSSLM